MGECRGGGGDGLIKLFGTTIPVPEAADAKDLQCNGGVSSNNSSSSSAESDDDAKETTHQLDGSDPQPQPEVVDAEDPNKPTSLADDDKPGQQGKPPMKKPDKVLPCPRCNSMDTKFCYFNNYNVNQPRHFCKNCQRYWTAGGAMRNVPVGAGRRKNKSVAAASQFLQRVRAALPADPALLKAANGGGGTVLSFGHAEPQQQVATHHLAKEKPLLVSVGSTTTTAGNSKSCSEGSRSSSTDDKNQSDKVEKPAASNGVVQQQQHPAASMWPYYPPGIAIPIFPSAPAYWGCVVPAAGGWSLPWPVQPPTPPQQGSGFSSPTCSAAPSSLSSGAADYLTLGKHARDDEDGRSGHHGNGKVWAPKTIRIDDDADEVAKSSIWSLVEPKGGDKHNTSNMMHGLRKGTVFEPKHEMPKTAKQAMITSSPLLHANPVALTRSLTFQEGA